MKVAAILKNKGNNVVTASPDDTIATVAELLKREGIGAVIVTGAGGAVSGILSERDIVRAIPEKGSGLLESRAADLMTREVVTCTPDMDVDEVRKLMTEGRFRHVPVMADGRLAGVISVGDVVKQRLDELEAEAGALRSYISTG
ncbi:MAG TPA: CBS domain-containing protein [Alphaproteobacteria bacterium]|nr:CBS domain-containing protein [Alphaproteobacteria bacterium]